MTLTKQKPRRVSSAQRKRTGQHHRYSRHSLKTYWPYLPVIAILTFGVFINGWLASAHQSVLGYATDMSVSSLFSDTNAQRSANGVAGLSLNGQLDQAAQAKANDMVARDYWSHNTPDGQTPWTFITAAGYSYRTAGENLAYGFDTAADTINGWMNSPEHRANLLNSGFVDVGFGVANSANYQGTGPETVVVAMYASPYSVPAPAPTQPSTPVTSKPASAATNPAPSALNTDTPTPVSDTSSQPTTSSTPITADPTSQSGSSHKTTTTEPPQQRIVRLQLASDGQAAVWSMALSSLLVVGLLSFFVMRHALAWRRVLVKGESFVLHHPLIDIATAGIITLCLVLSQTAGLIR